MAHSRAGAVLAVFAVLAACQTSPRPLDGQEMGDPAMEEPDTVTVTIRLALERSEGLISEGYPPQIETDPDPVRVSRGDIVRLHFATGAEEPEAPEEVGPWTVQLSPLSPFGKIVIAGEGAEPETVVVRNDASPGIYKSIIAVCAHGRVFVVDPHFVVGR